MLKPLRLKILLGIFLVAGVLSWGGTRLWDSLGTLPSVPLAAPIVLALIAAILTATALTIRSRLAAQRDRDPEANGVDPMMAARAVLFGQASALVSALIAGMYAGFAVHLLIDGLDYTARRDQAVMAGFAVAAGAAVVAAALFLERVCRLPDDGDDPDPRTGLGSSL